mgnify:CR=1 FL=1
MIEIKNVVKTFDGFRALDGLTMTVPHGAVYGLVGPNGRGQVHHHPPSGGNLPAGQRRRAGGRTARL